jgi:hypothetical protein
MNMFRQIKGVPVEEGPYPWLIPVDDTICFAQHIIVPPIHINVLSISLADIYRRIDKIGVGVGAGLGIEQRLWFSLGRLPDRNGH